MRIIGGKARSIVVEAPNSLAVRPTADRAREALFNSLGDLPGFTVLDLYAGSGAMGLEAASRGAANVVFVEREKKHCEYIERNVIKVSKAVGGFSAKVVNSAVSTAPWFGDTPNLILADPPYPESLEEFKLLIANEPFRAFAKGAKMVWEMPDTPGIVGEFLLASPRKRTVRRFGGVDFLIILDME